MKHFLLAAASVACVLYSAPGLAQSEALNRAAKRNPGYLINFGLALAKCHVQLGYSDSDKAIDVALNLLRDHGISNNQIKNLMDKDRVDSIIKEEGGCYEFVGDEPR